MKKTAHLIDILYQVSGFLRIMQLFSYPREVSNDR